MKYGPIVLFVASLATAAASQDLDESAPAIRAVLDAAAEECRDMAGADGPPAKLERQPGALTWLDLDGDGEPNDTVIDFNRIFCTASYSLWHGSGGSRLILVRDGVLAGEWTGGTWRVTEYGGAPLVLIGRHGSFCDSFGARGCVQAITVDEDGFWAVTLEPGPDRIWR